MVGIDIGGTFTDVAATEVGTGRTTITKVPSIPDDPSLAVVAGLDSFFQSEPEVKPADIRFFAHGTTVATNALLEENGATAALLITRGFRAVYELRGGQRPSGSDLIDSFYQKPKALIPQRLTAEIPERLAYDGSEVEPLDEQAVRRAVRDFRDRGVNSIAVCYLFSFMNPAHEQRTAEIIVEEHPGCRVSLSTVVLPLIREYQRISTTALDAYVGPVIEGYLRRIAGRLRELGLTTEQLFIMQSNGGLMRIDVAARYPNQTLLSGPAAGVVFGASIGQLSDQSNVVTFDMGGTSTDISVMAGNAYQETRQGQINGQDIGTPMIQIRTLGAGGGTVAWLGPDGLLKAGPQSAGADPGPACYARGGVEPTVTDANVVLGYLDPSKFAGGKLDIDPGLSAKAIRERVGQPLGMALEQAALGIVRVVSVNMEVGLRLSFIERGLDPRRFALVAFGGAGPVHACRVARNVGIPTVVIPPFPGISCAMGLLQTDVKHYFLQSHMASLGGVPAAELNALFANLEDQARREASEEGFAREEVELHRQLDLRYPHQGYELTVACPAEPLQDEDKQGIRRSFDRLHEQVYGTAAADEMPEIVNVRVLSVSKVPRLELRQLREGGCSPDAALRGHRPALFEEDAEYVDTPIYQREALLAGNVIDGPAIVEQFDSTSIILPKQQARVDAYGNLIVR
ncbi:MAG TPA: hydantoinase/oxoprolinase family protein [Chloroflexota bacterium]|nr:hydantoinase/oxoprolinase family protein [Chloroflexota bacterium]